MEDTMDYDVLSKLMLDSSKSQGVPMSSREVRKRQWTKITAPKTVVSV